jgi:hypothetical protein
MDVLTPQQGTAAHAVPAVLALLCWCCFAGNLMRCVAAVPACALLSPARACCRDLQVRDVCTDFNIKLNT